MEHDGEAGKAALDLFKDVEAELGLGAGLEFVCAVAGTDGDCEAVHTGALDEFLHLGGIGIACILSGNLDVIFNAFEPAELALDYNPVVMSIFDDLTGQRDIILE